jgi:hypothetical protein
MFTLIIDTKTKAFHEYPEGEITRILRRVISNLESGVAPSGFLRDINGHVVGEYELSAAKTR